MFVGLANDLLREPTCCTPERSCNVSQVNTRPDPSALSSTHPKRWANHAHTAFSPAVRLTVRVIAGYGVATDEAKWLSPRRKSANRRNSRSDSISRRSAHSACLERHLRVALADAPSAPGFMRELVSLWRAASGYERAEVHPGQQRLSAG